MALTNKEIRRALNKMRVRSGDVILVRKDSALADGLEQMMEIIKQTSLKDIIIFVVDDPCDIKAISEQEMAKNGWYKQERLKTLFVRKRVSEDEKQD